MNLPLPFAALPLPHLGTPLRGEPGVLFAWLVRWHRGHAAAWALTIVAGAGRLAWLAGNLLRGSQICWVLRPFIGRPQDAVEFLGPDPWQGSFYETVFEAARVVWLGHAPLDP
jgi:hypothetical protein